MSGDAVYTCLEAIFVVILGNLPESIAFLPKICYAVYERCSIWKGAVRMKRMFAGLAAVLLLLGGCSAGNPDVQVYYTPESQTCQTNYSRYVNKKTMRIKISSFFILTKDWIKSLISLT